MRDKKIASTQQAIKDPGSDKGICAVFGQERGTGNHVMSGGGSSSWVGSLIGDLKTPEAIAARLGGDVVLYKIENGAPVFDENGEMVVEQVIPREELKSASAAAAISWRSGDKDSKASGVIVEERESWEDDDPDVARADSALSL